MDQIYLAEDDAALRAEEQKLLLSYGYGCALCENFRDIVQDVLQKAPALVLLDVNLPYSDGYQICRELRRRSAVPIIIVTSRSSEMDELMSMNLGADDYVAKPFHPQILLARIAAVLKRTSAGAAENLVCYRDVTFDLGTGTARGPAGTAELTKNELRILSVLLAKRGRIVPREELMNALWQSDEFVDDNTLTVNVNRLRRKLESIGAPEFLATKRGVGYYL